MKKKVIHKKLILPGILLVLALSLYSQTTYTYRLSGNFHSDPVSANDLIVIPNNSGDTGSFVQRSVPASTCGQQGTAQGYFYADDAGLQFNNPTGFIDKSYSIAFNFQVDEFISPPQWVRILSFTHTDDVGIYIKLTNPPYNGTLEFWPNGTVGTADFFTTVNFYQMILVRNDTGVIKIYVNGSEFGSYDDSETQQYVPQAPNHYIIWFRDDPSVLAGEASPGFVQNIIIANYAWTPVKVAEIWERFCSSLLGTGENSGRDARVYPNPATDHLYIVPGDNEEVRCLSVFDITGQELISSENPARSLQVFDIGHFCPGMYFVRMTASEKTRVFRFIKK
jgi:hypothetical protein